MPTKSKGSNKIVVSKPDKDSYCVGKINIGEFQFNIDFEQVDDNHAVFGLDLMTYEANAVKRAEKILKIIAREIKTKNPDYKPDKIRILQPRKDDPLNQMRSYYGIDLGITLPSQEDEPWREKYNKVEAAVLEVMNEHEREIRNLATRITLGKIDDVLMGAMEKGGLSQSAYDAILQELATPQKRLKGK